MIAKSTLASPKKICVLRLSAIGDVCNTLAVVQEIQRTCPHAEISWVVGQTEYALLKNIPNINFICFNKNAGLGELLKLRKRLQGIHFDVLLHMQCALRASLVSLCIHATRRIGFDRQRAHDLQWLFTNEKISPQAQAHVLEGFMSFAHQLGVKPFKPRWDIPIENKALTWANTQTQHQTYAVISTTASKPERNWSVDNYALIADHLSSTGLNVVLTSGTATKDIAFTKRVASKTKQQTIDLAGKTDLQQFLALVANAQLVISPDSGPAHIAAMLSTPVIGLYAHSNPMRTGPWGFLDKVVSRYEHNIIAQTGKSIEALPWGVRAKGKHLMQAVSVDDVVKNISGLTH